MHVGYLWCTLCRHIQATCASRPPNHVALASTSQHHHTPTENASILLHRRHYRISPKRRSVHVSNTTTEERDGRTARRCFHRCGCCCLARMQVNHLHARTRNIIAVCDGRPGGKLTQGARIVCIFSLRPPKPNPTAASNLVMCVFDYSIVHVLCAVHETHALAFFSVAVVWRVSVARHGMWHGALSVVKSFSIYAELGTFAQKVERTTAKTSEEDFSLCIRARRCLTMFDTSAYFTGSQSCTDLWGRLHFDSRRTR